MERGPRKIKVDYGRSDMYRAYNKEVKEMPMKYKIDASLYSRILNNFNQEISKAILEDAYEFLIPMRLGNLRIKKYKQEIKIDEDGKLNTRSLSPDWKATNELWEKNPEAKAAKKIVYHTNKHSDGYRYKWYFSNHRNTCKNKAYYFFAPTRTNKRRLAELIKDESFKGDYYM